MSSHGIRPQLRWPAKSREDEVEIADRSRSEGQMDKSELHDDSRNRVSRRW